MATLPAFLSSTGNENGAWAAGSHAYPAFSVQASHWLFRRVSKVYFLPQNVDYEGETRCIDTWTNQIVSEISVSEDEV